VFIQEAIHSDSAPFERFINSEIVFDETGRPSRLHTICTSSARRLHRGGVEWAEGPRAARGRPPGHGNPDEPGPGGQAM